METRAEWVPGPDAWEHFIYKHPELGYKSGRMNFHNFLIGVNYLGRSASIILAGERRERCRWYSVLRSFSFHLPRAVGKSRTPKGLSTGLPCGQVTCPRCPSRQATASRVLDGCARRAA